MIHFLYFSATALCLVLFFLTLQKKVFQKAKELKVKNKELSKSCEKLQILEKSKDEFLSIASHELRTPMTVINGFTEFLLSGKFGSINSKQKNFLNIISRNTTELINLVNKMLDISRLEAGKMDFEWREISFPSFLEEAMEEFRIMCSKKNIQLSFQNPEKINLFIKSDPFKLKQILTNLVRNSYKFTPQKGKINIILKSYPQDSKFIQISVCDNGKGIPTIQQKIIFEKFHQIGSYLHKTYTGTGLGLNIVKLIVEKLGGNIWVKSQEGKGACFNFILPKKNDPQESSHN